MELRSNHKIELARGFILNSRANIFLTGKAGTGKTTLLRGVIQQISKRTVVAAPTGVAALNAGGVTLHSLFALSFAPFIPGVRREPRRISKNKLSLIRSIELLVIDEVSMVRADVMDAIDETLRMVRRSSKPFGGVQLLLIGDIQQLAPICRDEEWEMLREHYGSTYFFESHALRKTSYVTIELDEIFRQRDANFTDVLNAVRENRLSKDIFEALNSRYMPEFEPDNSDDYITLTTHNHTANMINSRKLAALRSPKYTFDARVTGEFSESSYPNDTALELKVGAQVLFIKNDVSPQKRYYNGLVGEVVEIDGKSVVVQPKSGGEVIKTESVQWESVDYKIGKDGEMEQDVRGTFTQLPLKCAWAITIHKSQGLSFDRAIIDAAGAFAHGQVYVALSRCRSIEGLVLRTPISSYSIIEDRTVESFCNYVSENQPTEKQLEEYKREAYCLTLCEIFEFEVTQRMLWDLMSELTGAVAKTYPKLMSTLLELLATFEKDIVKVGASFQQQLRAAIYRSEEYQKDSFIDERLRRASEYFTPRLEALQNILKQLRAVNPDSAETRKRLGEIYTRLGINCGAIFLGLKLCGEGFTIDKFIAERARIIAAESQSGEQAKSGGGSTKKPRERLERKAKRESTLGFGIDEDQTKAKCSQTKDITHMELYETLVAWRREEAEEMKKPAYCVLPNRTLMAIQEKLPITEASLKSVVGMGNVKMERYGDQILEIVKEYCYSNGVGR